MIAHSALPVAAATGPGPAPDRRHPPLLRTAAAVSLAGVVTFGLFQLMQALVAVEVAPASALAEPEPFVIAEHVPPETIDRRPPPAPPEAMPLPERARVTPVESQGPVEGGFEHSPQTRPEIDPGDAGLDGMIVAPPPLQLRVPPAYPASELRRGVSGDCTVQYDVLASGQTANISVLGCASAGFARASVAAVEQWRYQAHPGLAPDQVVQRSLQTTLVFNLED